jgi:hypothetical protein
MSLAQARCTVIMFAIMISSAGLSATETPHRIKVVVVQRQSSIHSSTGNLDIYLVRLVPKSGRAFVAKMIDEYPSYAATLPESSAVEGATFSAALRRTPYCDSKSSAGGADQSVRCFAVVHGSWKLSKPVRMEEMWWK